MTSDRITKRPGEDSGKDGGIYREVGSDGTCRENFATVPDQTRLPPTSDPDAVWLLIERTPDSDRDAPSSDVIKRPGENADKNGGIYQEVGPFGERHANYATVPDHAVMPPTSKPGTAWLLISRTPDGKR